MITTTFKKGTEIFRSSPSKNDYTKRPHLFASYNKDGYEAVKRIYAKYEGDQVHTYAAKRDLKLIDMSKPQNIVELLKNANNSNDIQAIKKAFRVKDNKADIIRFSRMKYDARVADLICKLGYDGYIAPKLEEKYGCKKFLQEVMICEAGGKLNHVASNRVTNKPLNPAKYRPNSHYNSCVATNDSLFEGALNGNFKTPSPHKKRRIFNNYNTPSPVRGSSVSTSFIEMFTH